MTFLHLISAYLTRVAFERAPPDGVAAQPLGAVDAELGADALEISLDGTHAVLARSGVLTAAAMAGASSNLGRAPGVRSGSRTL